MKYVNGIRIMNEIFDSFIEYEQLPNGSSELIKRLLDDLHYDKKIKESTLEHFKEYYEHLFETGGKSK